VARENRGSWYTSYSKAVGSARTRSWSSNFVEWRQTAEIGDIGDLTSLCALRPGTAIAADVGGENVQGLVERVAQTPGTGRTIIKPALERRQQGQLVRFADDLKKLTGARKTAFDAIDEVAARQKAVAGPRYSAAYAADVSGAPEVQEIRKLMATPDGRRAWAHSRRIATNEDGVTLPDLDRAVLDTPHGRLLEARA
jgi:hypothetical protein